MQPLKLLSTAGGKLLASEIEWKRSEPVKTTDR